MYQIIAQNETLSIDDFISIFSYENGQSFAVLMEIPLNVGLVREHIESTMIPDARIEIDTLFPWGKTEDSTIFKVYGTAEWEEEEEETDTEEIPDDPFKPGKEESQGLSTAELWELAENGFIPEGHVYVDQNHHKVVFSHSRFEPYYTIAEKYEGQNEAWEEQEAGFRTKDRWSFFCNDGSSLHHARKKNKIRF